ncbi:MAG: winged helix-turn-helix transcriptional regulator [Ruminiclostridium sp.]|nr:winged helix-turn-helix transcriptional regulator [Ruminiclostridium sp.]
MSNKNMDNAKVFKAFCDENRLQILELLRSGEKCACVLLAQLNIGQSTLSHHMKIMVQSGIVASRNEGKWTYYSISLQGAQVARDLLVDLTTVDGESKDGCSCT